MGIFNKIRRKKPKKDEVSVTPDFLLAKYSFADYCKFFKVSGFEAEKEYNAYQDRRSWLISGHEKRSGGVLEVPLYYDEYIAYLEKHNLPDDRNSKSSYMSSKVKLDMKKATAGVRAQKLFEEFIKVTKPDRRTLKVANIQIGQWLEDKWDSIDNDFLVRLSKYIRTLEVEGKKETATRMIAYKQIIDSLKSNPMAKHIIKAMLSKLRE